VKGILLWDRGVRDAPWCSVSKIFIGARGYGVFFLFEHGEQFVLTLNPIIVYFCS
jgi:hypothetical protein